MIPTNEQETIALFSQLADELGYKLIEMGTSCPDAILQKGGQRVRAEFEYKARNFEKHKHPAEAVDLVICWHDDWPKSPVPILSLENYVMLAKPLPRWTRFLLWLQGIWIAYLEYRTNVRLARIKNNKRATCKVCGNPTRLKCNYEERYRGFPQVLRVEVAVATICPSCGYVSIEIVGNHWAGHWAIGGLPDADELQDMLGTLRPGESPIVARRKHLATLLKSANGNSLTHDELLAQMEQDGYKVGLTTLKRDLAEMDR